MQWFIQCLNTVESFKFLGSIVVDCMSIFLAYLKGYNFMDASVISFSKKNNSLKLCFGRGLPTNTTKIQRLRFFFFDFTVVNYLHSLFCLPIKLHWLIWVTYTHNTDDLITKCGAYEYNLLAVFIEKHDWFSLRTVTGSRTDITLTFYWCKYCLTVKWI